MAVQEKPPVIDVEQRASRGKWIEDWDPEDDVQWHAGGRRVANRNLVFSVIAENIAFSVWLLWSAVVVFLPKAGFTFDIDQLFWLVSVPALVGAFVRLPYTFAVGRFGGRNWTVISALLLLVPTVGLIVCVSNPSTPYPVFLLVAATAGLGGGNFASSTANISFFFPQRNKGLALGVNAAGGNLGAAIVQLLIPIVVVGATGTVVLADAGSIWLVPIILSALLAWFFIDNLRISTVLADRLGGAAVTVACFLVMGAGVISVLFSLNINNYPWFFTSFMLLFAASGAANGSAYRMIPVIFDGRAQRVAIAEGIDPGVARIRGQREAAAVIGLTSAVGALGGFLIPRGIASSIGQTGSIGAAMYVLLGFYAICLVVTWCNYLRPRAVGSGAERALVLV